ncbi:MAG: bifunctional oligoribonuclease/PAP phosphatase NrnA [Sulfurospirillum sp.]
MYKEAWRAIGDARHILLISHVNPDGDAIGSALALYDALKRSGKKVSLFNATKELPHIYSFLPNVQKIKDKLPSFYDLVISCDCGSFDRLKIEKGDYKIINIDHHSSNRMFGDINLVDKTSASAGMVVFQLLEKNSVKITSGCATCIYVTIVEDTGFFSYSNLSEKTFECASKLVKYGADAKEIATLLRSRVSLAKTRLLGFVLSNFDLYFDAKVAFVYISKDLLASTGAKRYDTKNIVNVLRDIITVKVSVMILEEKNGGFKISLRSEEDADVSIVAKDFSGGGHKNSAGFEVADDDFEELKNTVLQKIKRII